MTDLRYEMFTDEGNAAVEAMVARIIKDIRLGAIRRTDLERVIQEGCKEVAKDHGEVWDTEPQYDIAAAISRECEEQGWKPVSRWDW